MLGGRNPLVNGQDYIVQLGAYCYSTIRARSINENKKKNSHQKITMAVIQTTLDETDCISHSTNTLRKGMNPVVPPPAMGK